MSSQDNGEIRWEEPKESQRRDVESLRQFRAELIANPGQWAVWRERPKGKESTLGSQATIIRRSMYGWHGYRWEAATRRGDNTTKLYVRCLGPIDEAVKP